VVFADRASYFLSDVFRKECFRNFRAQVHFICPRSPWEHGICERLHGLGIVFARKLLPTVPLLNTANPQLTIDIICNVLNSRPLGMVAELQLITPEVLAYGWQKKLGSAGASFTSSSAPAYFNPVKQCRKARRIFMDVVWSHLKKRSLLSAAAKSKKTRGLQLIDLTEKTPLLLFHQRQRKLASNFELVHVIGPRDLRRVEIVRANGSRSIENQYNLLPLRSYPDVADAACEAKLFDLSQSKYHIFGPTRVDQVLHVLVEDQEHRSAWYKAKVLQDAPPLVLVKWQRDGTLELLDLSKEIFKPDQRAVKRGLIDDD